jgi:acyl carrier protein
VHLAARTVGTLKNANNPPYWRRHKGNYAERGVNSPRREADVRTEDRSLGLDQAELVMAIEDTFKIELPDDEAAQVRTVGDCFDLIISKLDTKDLTNDQRDQVWETLCGVIVNQLGVEREEIERETTFLDDLGVD